MVRRLYVERYQALILLALAGPLSATPLPDWLLHESFAASEMARGEIDIGPHRPLGPGAGIARVSGK